MRRTSSDEMCYRYCGQIRQTVVPYYKTCEQGVIKQISSPDNRTTRHLTCRLVASKVELGSRIICGRVMAIYRKTENRAEEEQQI